MHEKQSLFQGGLFVKIFNRDFKKKLDSGLLMAIAMVLGGIILIGIGFWQEEWCEKNGLTVTATITDIKEYRGDVVDSYMYYGNYVMYDKLYEGKYLTDSHGSEPNRTVGDTVQIKVNPSAPSKRMGDGLMFFILAMPMLGYGGIWLYFELRYIFD